MTAPSSNAGASGRGARPPVAASGETSDGSGGRGGWMAVDWREHQRWVDVQGVSANVVELGPADGAAVVFVHGLGGRWQSWLESLPAAASAGYRAIAMDLPGFGASPMPREPISIPGYGRWLVAFLHALDVPAAALVGSSMGGFVAAEVAIRQPASVERLVLVSAAGISADKQPSDRILSAVYRAEALSTYITGAIVARAAWLARRPRLRRAAMRFVARHPERLPAPLAYEQIGGVGTPGFAAALDALGSYPIRDRLPEIACPTLLVWGRDDQIVPARDADVFEQLIADTRKVVWDDTGHVPMLERPREFNELVLSFLAEDAATGSQRRSEADRTAPTPSPSSG